MTDTAQEPGTANRPAEGLPPSFAQEQLWFVDRFHADLPMMHNVPVTVRLRGPLDTAALGRALDAFVARHEPLRTRLVSGEDGRPYQVVDAPTRTVRPVADLSEPDPAARETRLAEIVAEEGARPFDLAAGPLFRTRLVRLAADDHVLVSVAHGVVFDRGSARVLVRDLTALYAAEVSGAPAELPELPELPERFADHARRERERLQGDTLARLAGHWREVLGGFPNLQLPTDRPRPIVADHKGDVERLDLGAELLEGLRELSRRAGTTLPVTLLAALQTLLHRYSGQDEVVVGAATANRAELAPLVGFLADVLPIRTDLTGDPTFTELLDRVRVRTDDATEHGDLPFARLVEELRVERDTGRPPVFQVGLTVEEAVPYASAAGVTVRLERIGVLAAKYDLEFFAEVREDGLGVALSYATALFDAATARRLLGNLEVLLAGVVEDPSRRLSELPILTEAELRRELVEWNDTAADLPVVCIHEGFERQVERTPDGVAAELDGETETYARLNADANRIARRLRALGVGADVLVGVGMAPSIRRLAVLLGIMKAGGGYVPLDPSLPADRLSFMVEDTGMPVIVADASGADLPSGAARVVRVDREWDEIAALDPADPGFPVRNSDLAYVIYTSGSTGRPKGVMVEHRHAANFLVGMVGAWRITPEDRVLQFASLNFDVSVMDMFMTLLAGARAVLASPETLLSPPRLADLIRDREVTFACMPPAIVNLLSGQDFPDLRLVLSAGEELSGDLVRKWLRPGLEFYNGYGPTEASIGTCYSLIDGTVFPPPIGRPKPNYQAYVLDRHLNPVPVGVAGELHVGGAGVTRGYLNRPELTEERFIPDPFRPGGRLYKTGDLVRRLPDGNLVFLGRIDSQVKIRGLRVELGEVETALVAHPSVAQAVVVVAADRSGEKQLTGYVRFDPEVPEADRASVADLRQHLAHRLPAYMVPTYLIPLDAFPLTSNNKIDKSALPAPDAATEATSYTAPRTLIETVLADMYARLLGRERVGIDDGFFDLGGNSLQAMQLITQLRSDLAVDVNVAAVFLAPTPRQLTVLLREEHGLEDDDTGAAGLRTGHAAPAIVPRPAEVTEPPASFGQEQLWFIDRFAPNLPTYNIPNALRLRGPLDAAALRRALDALVARHEALRTRLVAGADGRPRQVIDEPVGADLTEVDLSAADRPEERLRELCAEQAARPFDLAAGPLFRTHLVRLAADEHALVVVVHHAVFDGWSIGVLTRDLAALYAAEVSGEPPALPDLPVQFADHTLWERERLGGSPPEDLVDYWRTTLADLPTLQLPTDRPRPTLDTFDGGVEWLDLGAESLAGLRELSRREGTTLFVTLMAALQVLLQRYTGQDDLVVGTVVAGRDHAELAPVIGFLVNTLPIRGDLSGDPTFTELLVRVRETTAGAYAHQDLPFAKLVEELRVERDPGRAPVFQVGFTLAEPVEDVAAAGVTMRVEKIDLLAAKFDLAFLAEPRGDGLWIELSYATALFDVATVRRLLGHLRVVLAGVVQNPHRRLSELPILTEAELRRELVEWNDTAADFPPVCIHEGFERQVERTPDGVAAELAGETVTYAELNADANRIARRLRALGVGADVLVGVAMTVSPRRLAVLLGILKAGGGYVPLDPSLPAERLSFMVEDTGMPVIVADASGADLPSGAARVVRVDREWDEIAALDPADPGFPVRNSDLAYVIYTSGSTGRPKGVMVEHRHAANFLVGMVGAWRITPEDRVLQFASLNFDVSVMDMFMTLLAGARAVLVPPDVLSSPPRLADLMRETKVTFACLPPAVVNLLSGQDFPDLRIVLSAGEELSGDLVRKWLRPGLEFYNGYGPTEASIGTCYSLIDGTVFPPPIGRPKPNYQAYVLDRHLNPVPVGVAGELHVGGAGVTRGYLNRPELTEERFIPDPFSGKPGARLYKTGDLVRRLPDGNLVFLGRIDSQVKIHGLRVELGEIETALVAHPSVAQAVVVLAPDASGEKQLTGYVRLDPAEPAAAVADLRQHLTHRLPAYMVPTYLIELDTFPLTSNGKIDKAALPAPGAAADTGAYTAPRTLVETVLADTYARLLGRERVGIDDGFFDAGGNSLQAMQLVTALRDDLAVDVNLAAIFLAPTPRQLTVLLREEYGLEDDELGDALIPE